MSELSDLLAELETALRDIGEPAAAEWTAERRRRADRDPEGVRADLRGRLGGMGSLNDLAIDDELRLRIRRFVGDLDERDGPPRMIPVEPGGPIRP